MNGEIGDNHIVAAGLTAGVVKVGTLTDFKNTAGDQAGLGIQVSGMLKSEDTNAGHLAFMDLNRLNPNSAYRTPSNESVFLYSKNGSKPEPDFWITHNGDARFNGTLGANVGLFNTGIVVGSIDPATGKAGSRGLMQRRLFLL